MNAFDVLKQNAVKLKSGSENVEKLKHDKISILKSMKRSGKECFKRCGAKGGLDFYTIATFSNSVIATCQR